MISQDLQLDSTGDLKIENGDFVVGPSDFQHIKDLINSFPGWWKQFSSVGVGARQYIGSTGMQQTLQRAVQLALQGDNYTNISITYTNGTDGTFNMTVTASKNGATTIATFNVTA